MSTVEKAVLTMFSLIFLYLIINNMDNVNKIILSLSKATNNQIAALQGR